MAIPKVNKEAETSTTLFVNIDDEPFEIIINKKFVRKLEAGEQDRLVFYVAQVGSKHLVDRILQKKGIADSNRDTESRQDLFSKILPEVSEEVEVKPLTEEEMRIQMQKAIKDNEARTEVEFGKLREESKSEIEKLKEEITKLKEKKVGRPPKTTTE